MTTAAQCWLLVSLQGSAVRVHCLPTLCQASQGQTLHIAAMSSSRLQVHVCMCTSVHACTCVRACSSAHRSMATSLRMYIRSDAHTLVGTRTRGCLEALPFSVHAHAQPICAPGNVPFPSPRVQIQWVGSWGPDAETPSGLRPCGTACACTRQPHRRWRSAAGSVDAIGWRLAQAQPVRGLQAAPDSHSAPRDSLGAPVASENGGHFRPGTPWRQRHPRGGRAACWAAPRRQQSAPR